jgi:hypothetical protein
MKRSIGVLVLLAAVLAGFTIVATAGADPDGQGAGADRILRSGFVGNVPSDNIFGVPGAGAAWVLSDGRVDVRRDGRMDLKVEGLVLVSNGTVGNNTQVKAALFCGGKLVAESAPVPFSPQGDAEVHQTLAAATAPDGRCLAPTVFVEPVGGAARFFAVTGA